MRTAPLVLFGLVALTACAPYPYGNPYGYAAPAPTPAPAYGYGYGGYGVYPPSGYAPGPAYAPGYVEPAYAPPVEGAIILEGERRRDDRRWRDNRQDFGRPGGPPPPPRVAGAAPPPRATAPPPPAGRPPERWNREHGNSGANAGETNGSR